MSFDYQSQVTPEPKEMTGSLPTGLYCTFHIVFITVTAKKQLILELTLQAPIFFRLISIYFLRELGGKLQTNNFKWFQGYFKDKLQSPRPKIYSMNRHSLTPLDHPLGLNTPWTHLRFFLLRPLFIT